jgi:4-hydroxy-2-oxoheptanedioate aldolase
MGALTLLLPYIQSAEEAKDAVSSVTYGPNGLRGMAGMTRATRYGMVENYFKRASEEICLLVQVETIEAIEQLDDIALTPGIDGVFIGPADLSASMGYPGEVNHPEVVKVIINTISKLNSLNVPSGILTLDFDSAKRYINAGTSFTAVGVDMVLLAESTRNLRKQFT